MKKVLLLTSHLWAVALVFALGVYALPDLIAPPAPSGRVGAMVAASQSRKRSARARCLTGGRAHSHTAPTALAFALVAARQPWLPAQNRAFTPTTGPWNFSRARCSPASSRLRSTSVTA